MGLEDINALIENGIGWMEGRLNNLEKKGVEEINEILFDIRMKEILENQ